MEKRRKEPSYLIPIVFFLMEILIMWLVLSLFSWDINPLHWNMYLYIIVLLWLSFSGAKLQIVLTRQKKYYD